jgi:hypothetical protein
VIDRRDDVLSVAFPYFGGRPHEHFPENDQGGDVLLRNVPAKRVALADGEAVIATVFDLLCANYGLDRGLGGACAKSYDDNVPYTPAWRAPITGGPELFEGCNEHPKIGWLVSKTEQEMRLQITRMSLLFGIDIKRAVRLNLGAANGSFYAAFGVGFRDI